MLLVICTYIVNKVPNANTTSTWWAWQTYARLNSLNEEKNITKH